jgi:hypothetical protein
VFDRALALIALAVTIVCGLSPYLWPSVPAWVAQAGLAIGLFVIGLAVGLIIGDRRNPRAELVDRAELVLHSYGDDRTPTRVSDNNIWRWYILRVAAVFIEAETGRTERRSLPTSLYVTFDQPVRVGTLTISADDFKLPLHEVKEFNNRFAIIVFDGELPTGTLRIRVE